MADFAGKLGEVKKEIIRERRNKVTADDYDDLEDQAREKATNDDWVELLTMVGKTNTVESTIDNAVIILNNDEHLKGRLMLNEFSLWEDVVKPYMWDKSGGKYPQALNDTDINQMRRYLEKYYGIKSKDAVKAAIDITAQENGYNPVKNYLDALPAWDGEERLDRLLIKLFGVVDTQYSRAVTRKTFCAAVKRIYHPGIKFDHMLTLIGVGGNGKSTFLSKMGGDWFTDNVKLTSDERNNLEVMRGKWILEIAEMRGFSKVDNELVKQFLSRTEDIYRRVYKERDIVHPRQSVFIGTHNKSDFLHDETGNRRYWPIQTTTGEEDAAEVWQYLTPVTVAQLWAEAKERVAQGEPLYLDTELEKIARGIQHTHLESDAWEEDIYKYIEGKDEVTTKELWDMALAGSTPIGKREQNRIAKIMRIIGWENTTTRRNGLKVRIWVKAEHIKKPFAFHSKGLIEQYL